MEVSCKIIMAQKYVDLYAKSLFGGDSEDDSPRKIFTNYKIPKRSDGLKIQFGDFGAEKNDQGIKKIVIQKKSNEYKIKADGLHDEMSMNLGKIAISGEDKKGRGRPRKMENTNPRYLKERQSLEERYNKMKNKTPRKSKNRFIQGKN